MSLASTETICRINGMETINKRTMLEVGVQKCSCRLKRIFTEFHRRKAWRLRETLNRREGSRIIQMRSWAPTSQLKESLQSLTQRKRNIRREVRTARNVSNDSETPPDVWTCSD